MNDNMNPISNIGASNAGAAETSTPFFDFFGLPRELRNMVYDQPCFFDTHLCCEPSCTNFKITVRKPTIAMLLVSHQFSREYREGGQAVVTIIAEDGDKVDVINSPMEIIKPSGVDHLEARLIVLDRSEFDKHLNWLNTCSTEAGSLRSIKVDFYADLRRGDYTLDAAFASFVSSSIHSTNKLHHMRVFSSPDPFHDRFQPPNTRRRRCLLFEWSLGDDPDLARLDSPIESIDPRRLSRTAQSMFLNEESGADGQGVRVPDDDSEIEDGDSDSDSEDSDSVDSGSEDSDSVDSGSEDSDPEDSHDDSEEDDCKDDNDSEDDDSEHDGSEDHGSDHSTNTAYKESKNEHGEGHSSSGNKYDDQESNGHEDDVHRPDRGASENESNNEHIDECVARSDEADGHHTRDHRRDREREDGDDSAGDGDDDNSDNSDDSDSDDSDNDDDPATENAKRDTLSANANAYFDFFGLPREMRDMIYKQPGMLEEQIFEMQPRTRHDFWDIPSSLCASLLTTAHPRTSLLLVSRQFNKEYRSSYKDQLEFSIRERRDGFDVNSEPPAILEKANIFKVEVALMRSLRSTFGGSVSAVEDWLAAWSSQLPALHTIDITIITSDDAMRWSQLFPTRKPQLNSIAQLDKVKCVQVATMGTPHLLVKWTARDGPGVKLLETPIELPKREFVCDEGPIKKLDKVRWHNYDDADEGWGSVYPHENVTTSSAWDENEDLDSPWQTAPESDYSIEAEAEDGEEEDGEEEEGEEEDMKVEDEDGSAEENDTALDDDA